MACHREVTEQSDCGVSQRSASTTANASVNLTTLILSLPPLKSPALVDFITLIK